MHCGCCLRLFCVLPKQAKKVTADINADTLEEKLQLNMTGAHIDGKCRIKYEDVELDGKVTSRAPVVPWHPGTSLFCLGGVSDGLGCIELLLHPTATHAQRSGASVSVVSMCANTALSANVWEHILICLL